MLDSAIKTFSFKGIKVDSSETFNFTMSRNDRKCFTIYALNKILLLWDIRVFYLIMKFVVFTKSYITTRLVENRFQKQSWSGRRRRRGLRGRRRRRRNDLPKEEDGGELWRNRLGRLDHIPENVRCIILCWRMPSSSQKSKPFSKFVCFYRFSAKLKSCMILVCLVAL